MKEVTLAQGNQVLNLILQKKVPSQQLQRLLGSGLLSDLLDAHIDEVDELDRDDFRHTLGLNPLSVWRRYDDDSYDGISIGQRVRHLPTGEETTITKIRKHWRGEIVFFAPITPKGSDYIVELPIEKRGDIEPL